MTGYAKSRRQRLKFLRDSSRRGTISSAEITELRHLSQSIRNENRRRERRKTRRQLATKFQEHLDEVENLNRMYEGSKISEQKRRMNELYVDHGTGRAVPVRILGQKIPSRFPNRKKRTDKDNTIFNEKIIPICTFYPYEGDQRMINGKYFMERDVVGVSNSPRDACVEDIKSCFGKYADLIIEIGPSMKQKGRNIGSLVHPGWDVSFPNRDTAVLGAKEITGKVVHPTITVNGVRKKTSLTKLQMDPSWKPCHLYGYAYAHSERIDQKGYQKLFSRAILDQLEFEFRKGNTEVEITEEGASFATKNVNLYVVDGGDGFNCVVSANRNIKLLDIEGIFFKKNCSSMFQIQGITGKEEEAVYFDISHNAQMETILGSTIEFLDINFNIMIYWDIKADLKGTRIVSRMRNTKKGRTVTPHIIFDPKKNGKVPFGDSQEVLFLKTLTLSFKETMSSFKHVVDNIIKEHVRSSRMNDEEEEEGEDDEDYLSKYKRNGIVQFDLIKDIFKYGQKKTLKSSLVKIINPIIWENLCVWWTPGPDEGNIEKDVFCDVNNIYFCRLYAWVIGKFQRKDKKFFSLNSKDYDLSNSGEYDLCSLLHIDTTGFTVKNSMGIELSPSESGLYSFVPGEDYCANLKSPPDTSKCRILPQDLHAICYHHVFSVKTLLETISKEGYFETNIVKNVKEFISKKPNPKCSEAKGLVEDMYLQIEDFPPLLQPEIKCLQDIISYVSTRDYTSKYQRLQFRFSTFLVWSMNMSFVNDKYDLSAFQENRAVVNEYNWSGGGETQETSEVVSASTGSGELLFDTEANIFESSGSHRLSRNVMKRRRKKKRKKKKQVSHNSSSSQLTTVVNSLPLELEYNSEVFPSIEMERKSDHGGVVEVKVSLGLQKKSEEEIEKQVKPPKYVFVRYTNARFSLWKTFLLYDWYYVNSTRKFGRLHKKLAKPDDRVNVLCRCFFSIFPSLKAHSKRFFDIMMEKYEEYVFISKEHECIIFNCTVFKMEELKRKDCPSYIFCGCGDLSDFSISECESSEIEKFSFEDLSEFVELKPEEYDNFFEPTAVDNIMVGNEEEDDSDISDSENMDVSSSSCSSSEEEEKEYHEIVSGGGTNGLSRSSQRDLRSGNFECCGINCSLFFKGEKGKGKCTYEHDPGENYYNENTCGGVWDTADGFVMVCSDHLSGMYCFYCGDPLIRENYKPKSNRSKKIHDLVDFCSSEDCEEVHIFHRKCCKFWYNPENGYKYREKSEEELEDEDEEEEEVQKMTSGCFLFCSRDCMRIID